MDLVDLTASVRTHPHKSLKGSLGGLGDDEVGAIDDDASTDRDISCFDGSWTGVNVIGVLEGVASGDCAGSGQGSDTSNGRRTSRRVGDISLLRAQRVPGLPVDAATAP